MLITRVDGGYEVQADRPCRLHGKTHKVFFTDEQYAHWDATMGEFVQVRMPNHTADQREILMTGMCQKAWDKFIGKDE